MANRLNPYLNFADNARQAMTFYQEVFGGELHLNTFGDMGPDVPNPDGIMHAQLETPSGYTLMASDLPPDTDETPANGQISLSGEASDGDELRGYWDKLSDGGSVVMPLERQMWGDDFGMCVDRFGVAWMVNIAGEASG